MKRNLLLVCILAISSLAYAQTGTVTGRVIDPDTEEALIGANVIIEGTVQGATTDIDGYFKIVNIDAKSLNLIVTYIGYDALIIPLTVIAGTTSDIGTVSLSTNSIGLKEIEVIASVAIDRKTPVAVSTIKGQYIQDKLSSQEFPEILKGTPGVYVTKAGGGYGDSRINIRGFDSQNVAVMINGVPVNDMENGRVYWSNWAGLSDVTGSMQVQRGLGASKVAVPSVGGTINIVSKATDAQKGGSVFVGIGNNLYNKIGVALSTGVSEDGWALTLQGTRTQGQGYVDGTQFLGWSYYVNIAKKINNHHLLTLSIIGAQQRHGQRENRLPVSYFNESPNGIRQNNDWGKLGGDVVWVEDNFYHKPQMAINHYYTINTKSELATTLYGSYGTGGGGGQSGSNTGLFDLRTGSAGTKFGYIDLDAIVEINEELAANGEESAAYLRASRNDHKWMGLISVYSLDFSSNWDFSAGIDLRYYKGSHFREITDLLGGDFVLDNSDDNNPDRIIGVGDKFSYNNDGIVNWAGAFVQAEYTWNDLNAFVSVTGSNTNYKREDFYQYPPGEQLSDAYNFFGYVIKGGINYNFSDHHNLYGNAGYFTRAPFFNTVFSQFNNDANEDAVNEKVLSYEIGYGLRYSKVSLNVNLYRTNWKDKNFTQPVQVPSGDEIIANVLGVDAMHQGAELEASYNPLRRLRLSGSLSFGDWIWQNDLIDVPLYDGSDQVGEVDLYIAGVKVGDAAQTTAAFGIDYELFNGFFLNGDFTYADQLYARFDPLQRGEAPAAGEVNSQAILLPSFGLFDFGFRYNFPIGNMNANLNARVNNAFDTQYVPDALDVDAANDETLADAYVYYGFGRTWTMSIRFMF